MPAKIKATNPPQVKKPAISIAQAYRILKAQHKILINGFVQVTYGFSEDVRKRTSSSGDLLEFDDSCEYRVCITSREKYPNLAKGTSCADFTCPDLRDALTKAWSHLTALAGEPLPEELA